MQAGHAMMHLISTEILHAKIFLQFVSFIWLCYWVTQLNYNYVHTFNHKETTYLLNMSDHGSSQCSKWEKGENMWWLIHNTPSFTSATLYAKQWLPDGNSFSQVWLMFNVWLLPKYNYIDLLSQCTWNTSSSILPPSYCKWFSITSMYLE